MHQFLLSIYPHKASKDELSQIPFTVLQMQVVRLTYPLGYIEKLCKIHHFAMIIVTGGTGGLLEQILHDYPATPEHIAMAAATR